jgi:hypothetical protein
VYCQYLELFSISRYSAASAQVWSGTPDSSQTIDWNAEGMTGGISNHTTIRPYYDSSSAPIRSNWIAAQSNAAITGRLEVRC